MSKRKKVKTELDGENILYHYIQKVLIEEPTNHDLSPEVKWFIEKALLNLSIWFDPKIYKEIPILLPYVIRDRTCRNKDHSLDKWCQANDKGLARDDNSLIKTIPRTLTIKSPFSIYNGAKMGNGFVACHIWRELKNISCLASQYEGTNSFVPNLVWLPTQLSKLTDREGSYAQNFLQWVSIQIYKGSNTNDPNVDNIWEELIQPQIKPITINEIDPKSLNFFESNEEWLNRRKKGLRRELTDILAILHGQKPGKKIKSEKYNTSLIDLVSRNADLAQLESWLRSFNYI